MNADQAVVQTVEVETAPLQCLCCDQPAFGENVIDTGQLCLRHTELRIFIWRLRKRGEEITPGGIQEYMRQARRPVTFRIYEVPELYQQMRQAGLLEEVTG